ncbi:uncharacterized protein LOC134719660 [Mytilus trossulus]|uniref:uncharacterized protein LOC134719660 n=1 Tax=Mytilus trossulus TaxID=6551 RepID=UPI00300549AA
MDFVDSSSPPAPDTKHGYALEFPFLGVWAEEEVSTFGHMSERVEIIDEIDDDNEDDAADDDDDDDDNDKDNMVTDLSPTYSIRTTQRKKKVIKNHHKGPIPEGYITSARKRQKTYSKRVKSLFTQGYRLHSMCGARIKIEITNEQGKTRSMCMPPFMTRSVMQQAGESAINVQEITEPLAPVEGTPKKRPMLIKQSSNTKTIKNLPGKKKGKENALSPNMKRVRNKCSICKIIFDSAADKAFQKKKWEKASCMDRV